MVVGALAMLIYAAVSAARAGALVEAGYFDQKKNRPYIETLRAGLTRFGEDRPVAIADGHAPQHLLGPYARRWDHAKLLRLFRVEATLVPHAWASHRISPSGEIVPLPSKIP